MPKARSVQISLCQQLLSSAPDPVRAQTRPLETRFLLCRECFWVGFGPDFGPDSRLEIGTGNPRPGRLLNRFLVPILGPESGLEIGTAKQNLHKAVLISGPESGPNIGTASEPKKRSLRSDNLAPRSRLWDRIPVPKSGPKNGSQSGPGRGFPDQLRMLRERAFRWDFDVARMFWLRARILTQPREQHLCPAKLGWPLARACQ